MILEKINYPCDLKKLNTKELEILAQEVRDLILGVVSKKGGHLASSLGAVELSIALHYCLNTPKDSVIFDVGHQCYPHKILTGRKEKFLKLREYEGLSGFPNRSESEYDLFTSGHASTAVSWAQGLAEAKKLNHDSSKTVAVIGDGSLTGGMCFEAFNHCGHRQSDILVIVNHNEMSISPSIGSLSRYLTKIISAPAYNRVKNDIESFIERFSTIKKLAARAKKFEEAIKSLIGPGMFFEELGFRYFGAVDGHNLEVLISTLKNVLSLKGPRVLHVITKKGKGYLPAETNPEDFHSASCFDIKTGASLKPSEDSFTDIFARKIVSLAREDKRIVAITAAMPQGAGLDLFKKEFPERFFDVGIAEEHAVGFACGLARQGFKPIVAIYSTFLQRALDQIIHDIALQKLNVVFVVDRAGVVGEDGPTHHGVFDIGYLRLIPNLVCIAPKDKEELEDSLAFAFSVESSVSIRYPKAKAYSLDRQEKISMAKAQTLYKGKDVCILSLGSMVKVACECAEILKQRGMDIGVVNARFIKPLDKELYRNLAANFKFILTCEEASLDCGFGSAVLEFFEQENLLNKTKVIRFGFPDKFITFASRENLLNMYGLSSQYLATRIQELLAVSSVKERVV